MFGGNPGKDDLAKMRLDDCWSLKVQINLNFRMNIELVTLMNNTVVVVGATISDEHNTSLQVSSAQTLLRGDCDEQPCVSHQLLTDTRQGDG